MNKRRFLPRCRNAAAVALLSAMSRTLQRRWAQHGAVVALAAAQECHLSTTVPGPRPCGRALQPPRGQVGSPTAVAVGLLARCRAVALQ